MSSHEGTISDDSGTMAMRRWITPTIARIELHPAYGGIRVVARASKMREGTVSKGVMELEAGGDPPHRVRHPGGGNG